MGNLFVVHEMANLPHMIADSWGDAIGQLGARMWEAGFTDSAYTGCVIERERSFPTALQLDSVAVALPHGASEHVWVPSIAVGTCERPVPFRSMVDPSKMLDVRLVVLIAVNEPESQLEILSSLSRSLTDPSFVQKVLAMDTGGEIAGAFRDALDLDR